MFFAFLSTLMGRKENFNMEISFVASVCDTYIPRLRQTFGFFLLLILFRSTLHFSSVV